MKYLLDTDHISILQDSQAAHHQQLTPRVLANARDVVVSVASLHEQAMDATRTLLGHDVRKVWLTGTTCCAECWRPHPPSPKAAFAGSRCGFGASDSYAAPPHRNEDRGRPWNGEFEGHGIGMIE